MKKAVIEIKKIMEKRRFNQEELAKVIGMSQGYISQLLNGKQRPSDDAKEAFERVLGIKPADWYR